MSSRRTLSILLTLAFCTPLAAQTYVLTDETNYTAGCVPPCTCPVQLFTDVTGSFALEFLGTNGGFDEYAVDDFEVVVAAGTDVMTFTGSGLYRIDQSQDPHVHEMSLDLVTNGVANTYTADLIESDGAFPDELNIDVGLLIGCFAENFHIVSEIVLPSTQFVRGDADGNGTVNALADALFILFFPFAGGPPPPCLEAADVDGNGTFNALVEALYLLSWQFTGGSTPPEPFPNCGVDDDNALGCNSSTLGCP